MEPGGHPDAAHGVHRGGDGERLDGDADDQHGQAGPVQHDEADGVGHRGPARPLGPAAGNGRGIGGNRGHEITSASPGPRYAVGGVDRAISPICDIRRDIRSALCFPERHGLIRSNQRGCSAADHRFSPPTPPSKETDGHGPADRPRPRRAGGEPRRPRREVRRGRVGRRARPRQVEDGAGLPPAQRAGRLGALHPAGHGRPRPDGPQRGRVRRRAGPLDHPDPPVGRAGRVHERRPLVRRHDPLRQLPALDPQAHAGRGRQHRVRLPARRRDRVPRLPRGPAARPRAAEPVEHARPDPWLRHRVHPGFPALPGPDGRLHGGDRLRAVQLRPRGRRRPVRVRLRPRGALRDVRPPDAVPADAQADGQADRRHRQLHAQAVHRRLGLGCPHEHEHPRRRLRRQPAARRRRPSGRGWSKLAYCFVGGLLRHARALSAITCPPSTPTSACGRTWPTAPSRGRRSTRRTATTTARACCASPATGRASRTAASMPRRTCTWRRRWR